MKRLAELVPLALVVISALAVIAFDSSSPDHLEPALAWCSPTLSRPFGCGEGGVDLTALVAHAVLRGIVLSIAVGLVGFCVGTPLGAAAALARGRFERVVDRACDLVQAFPTFLLALAVLSAVTRPTRWHIGVVFAVTAWAPFTRLALTQTRVLRSAAFVEAAVALGLAPARILLRHIVPNLVAVVAVQLGSSASATLVSEAALSFVGFGPSDGVSLGNVLDQGTCAMLRAPHVLIVGATSIVLVSSSMLVAARVLARTRPRTA